MRWSALKPCVAAAGESAMLRWCLEMLRREGVRLTALKPCVAGVGESALLRWCSVLLRRGRARCCAGALRGCGRRVCDGPH